MWEDKFEERMPEGYEPFIVVVGEKTFFVEIETFVGYGLPRVLVNGAEIPFRREFWRDWQSGRLDSAVRRYLEAGDGDN